MERQQENPVVEKEISTMSSSIPDRAAEALDQDLRKCLSTAAEHKVNQLLKVTMQFRTSVAAKIPKSTRVEEMLSQYPVF